MKTSDEIRAVAWTSLWKGRWLWKILAVWSVLYAIGLVAGYIVSFGEWLAGLEEWSRYLWIAFLGFLRRMRGDLLRETGYTVVRRTDVHLQRNRMLLHLGRVRTGYAVYGQP